MSARLGTRAALRRASKGPRREKRPVKPRRSADFRADLARMWGDRGGIIYHAVEAATAKAVAATDARIKLLIRFNAFSAVVALAGWIAVASVLVHGCN